MKHSFDCSILLIELSSWSVHQGRSISTCLGGDLEELSGLIVRDAAGLAVADGWMDFIHGGGDNPLFAFWLFVAVGSGDTRREVKTEVEIPAHVWRVLPETTKALCASNSGYDSRWAEDPSVVAWRTSHAR
jgi:hypothetical protein